MRWKESSDLVILEGESGEEDRGELLADKGKKDRVVKEVDSILGEKIPRHVEVSVVELVVTLARGEYPRVKKTIAGCSGKR